MILLKSSARSGQLPSCKKLIATTNDFSQTNTNREMKIVIILLVVFTNPELFGQNKIQIFLGSGYDGETCTVISNYQKGGNWVSDTLALNQEIRSNQATGLADSFKSNYSKNGRFELTIKINENSYLYRTDKVCRKSELRIDRVSKDSMDFCFLYKGKFLFY